MIFTMRICNAYYLQKLADDNCNFLHTAFTGGIERWDVYVNIKKIREGASSEKFGIDKKLISLI